MYPISENLASGLEQRMTKGLCRVVVQTLLRTAPLNQPDQNDDDSNHQKDMDEASHRVTAH